MEIVIKFRDSDARRVTGYLQRYFKKSKNSELASLAKAAILELAAAQAERELENRVEAGMNNEEEKVDSVPSSLETSLPASEPCTPLGDGIA